MTIENHETDADDITTEYRMTPTRILQIKFIGFLNALFNYIQWLKGQDAERTKDGE